MAIYHLESKIISRGTGRSAVAAASYMSCSKILNDYDGVQHDFTRKRGVSGSRLFCRIMLPSGCESNRQIRRSNAFLRELKSQMKKRKRAPFVSVCV